MARKRSRTFNFFMLSVIALALYGGWVIWEKKATKRVVSKVERSVKAAHKAW